MVYNFNLVIQLSFPLALTQFMTRTIPKLTILINIFINKLNLFHILKINSNILTFAETLSSNFSKSKEDATSKISFSTYPC